MKTDYFKEGNEFDDLVIGEFFAVIDCSVLLRITDWLWVSKASITSVTYRDAEH